jgi:hypothetical protein
VARIAVRINPDQQDEMRARPELETHELPPDRIHSRRNPARLATPLPSLFGLAQHAKRRLMFPKGGG